MEEQPALGLEQPLASYLQRIESLLRQIVEGAGLELAFACRLREAQAGELEAPAYVFDFSGSDSDLLLARHGELLDALEYLVLKALRLEEERFGKITFDCQDWRELRAGELKLTAQLAAQRAVETGLPYTLSPMPPRERRLVHLALKEMPQVRTESQGAGSERKVVIYPNAATGRSKSR